MLMKLLYALFITGVGFQLGTLNYRFDTAAHNLQPRIADGENAQIEEMPYVVKLISSTGICSGAIISESWILTAAHCISPIGTDVKIFAGSDKKYDNLTQKRYALSIHKHDYYEKGKISQYDLALIEVTPFKLNERIGIVKLSDDMWPQGDTKYNRSCLAAGWGVPEVGQKLVAQLQKLRVTASHGDRGCKCWPSFQNKRLICLHEKSGSGICLGDSGSALVCDDKAVGIAHIVYLVDSCDPLAFKKIEFKCTTTAGVYTYICPHLNWIRRYVPSVPMTPASCRGSKYSHKELISFVLLKVLLLI
ncbi:trypsin V-B-like isoform X2 [Cimex lectularius]|uniref:trypsin n=1 Tax=Cimex lectularius TaxID=79782 RepID=A0A8I6RN27_CIMLE|nr:trypsin V-B-like isoform X2 [Cimex lectularius]